jgi:hypothetical protein
VRSKPIRTKFPGSRLKVAVFSLDTSWVVKLFLELQEEEFNKVCIVTSSTFEFAQPTLKEMQKDGETLIFNGAAPEAKFAAITIATSAIRALK